jgi:hypothetical protein
MKGYVEQKLWHEIAPEDKEPPELWVARYVLRLDVTENITTRRLRSYIYSAYHSIRQVDSPELNHYNSARADLVAEIITPPEEEPRGKMQVDLEPSGDPSYWLATYVLGFSEHEISVLCNVDRDSLQDPDRAILPLLKAAIKVLKGLEFKGKDYLTAYHRARYLLVRYYLDAHYYERV